MNIEFWLGLSNKIVAIKQTIICTKDDLRVKLNLFSIIKKNQTKKPVIIGVIKYRYDKSSLEKLLRKRESLNDLLRMKNDTIKKEYKKPYRVGLYSSFFIFK